MGEAKNIYFTCLNHLSFLLPVGKNAACTVTAVAGFAVGAAAAS